MTKLNYKIVDNGYYLIIIVYRKGFAFAKMFVTEKSPLPDEYIKANIRVGKNYTAYDESTGEYVSKRVKGLVVKEHERGYR